MLMDKVKVNETVAGWIEKGMKSAIISNPQHCKNKVVLSNILRNLHASDLHENGITLTILARAIEEGYEVEYEFKVGDIVKRNIDGAIYSIKSINGDDITVSWSEVRNEAGTFSKGDLTLIAKSENREDLKKDE
jgi:hypothetical protein